MGMDLLEAKTFPSYTLACTMIGYLLGILLIPKYVSQKNALIGCTIIGLLLSLGVVFADFEVTLFGHHANASIFFLNALGFPECFNLRRYLATFHSWTRKIHAKPVVLFFLLWDYVAMPFCL